jgi:hypothetical protein
MEQNNIELMRIAGITESEVAWSNIYAYYMNPRNEPEYASAFTTALIELCGLNCSEVLPDNNYQVSTEVATPSLSRIDILIEGEKSIIIENKVNHMLNNPLKEYWDYAINPAVLIVLTISRLSEHELEWNKLRCGADYIKCVNITHYDLMTQTKKILGKEFASPILKELENIIIKKTVIMPVSLYIRNNEERLNANRIYEQESKRRQAIAMECMELKAFAPSDLTQIIQFKSCPNNNWVHYRYRGHDDLVIGVMCAYLWDWERYETDSKRRINKSGPELKLSPVITLFVQVHGNLYREIKRNNKEIIKENGYEIPGKFCHVVDFDIDMSEMSEKISRKGELASFLTEVLQDRKNCRILDVADEIYKTYLLPG